MPLQWDSFGNLKKRLGSREFAVHRSSRDLYHAERLDEAKGTTNYIGGGVPNCS